MFENQYSITKHNVTVLIHTSLIAVYLPAACYVYYFIKAAE